MVPFHKGFVLSTIDEYTDKINENQVGDYLIKKVPYFKDKIEGYLYEKNENLDIEVIELLKGNETIMRLDPKDIQGSYQSIKMARGRVGVVGLGLGYVVQEMAKKDQVTEIIVYEVSEEVISLYNQNFEKNSKIKIVAGDAYNAQSHVFDYFYVDIYGYELSEDVVDDYIRFNDLHEIDEYSFFGLEHFLLSCNYEEIIWVYIPENWMVMSKSMFEALDTCGYLEYYKKLDEKLVSKILALFKEVLNDEE
jgi:hypothetical protein